MTIATRIITITLLLSASLTGCIVSPLKESNPDRSLNWCPPLPNCVSTEAATFVHSIQSFSLDMPMNEAWPLIQETVNQLPRTNIEIEYPGYIYAKSHSAVFRFPDYFEVLAVPSENRLNVRSSALLGVTDFFVNYLRTEKFRDKLAEKGVIKKRGGS
jgi:uncharacterized protein (DUF1499 family)